MSSSIHIRCTGCNARIKAPSQLIGQTRDCPGCGKHLRIERKIPDDSDLMVVYDEKTAGCYPAGVQRKERVILLVDDDRELNDGLRSLLEKRGHVVLQAFDGMQAKVMLQRQLPDLMILDIMMPRMGGYPVLEYLQERSDAPPVLMITAKEGTQHKIYAEYLGVVDYLYKPFAIERFLKSVEEGLSRKQADPSVALAE